MWKLLFQSVRGLAHVRGGEPCQDHCRVRLRRTRHGPVLVLACADGAGSARLADVGARVACRGIVRIALAAVNDSPTTAIDRTTYLSWLHGLRTDLDAAALAHGAAVHDLACTLLFALVGEQSTVFAQIGDGVIVAAGSDGYQPIFWPQSGEYANSTNFVTDATFADHLDFASHPGCLDEVALLTDGLQGLALNLTARTVHAPFFRPMFAKLRTSRPGEGLAGALRRFLDSSAVNARSDDDKTLILATRGAEALEGTHGTHS
jgi:hypothetical protein